MAVAYVWPGSLPQEVRTGYTESAGMLILRTPMDAGPAKMRQRGQRPDVLKISLYMTQPQLQTLQTFAQTTLKGTARFGFPHPRTRQQVEVRIIPGDGGELYQITDFLPDQWIVSMGLEVQP